MVEFDWTLLGPILLVTVLALIVLCIDIVRPENRGRLAAYTALVGTAVAIGLTLELWGSEPRHGFGGMIILDNFALFFNLIFMAGTGLTLFVSSSYLEREGAARTEYYVLILTATVGMMLMAAGGDLIVIFLGLEMMSISLYILVGFLRGQVRSNEASMKYLLLGAFATGFLLYGDPATPESGEKLMPNTEASEPGATESKRKWAALTTAAGKAKCSARLFPASPA